MGSGTVLLGIALDDPSRTPPDRCRYDVGIIIREGERLPLDTRRVRGGRYAVFEIPHTEREVSRFWEDLERLTAGCRWTAPAPFWSATLPKRWPCTGVSSASL